MTAGGTTPYWNPIMETMPRAELEPLRWRKLSEHLAHLYAHSPFWRARMDENDCAPHQIGSIEEFKQRTPILTRHDLMDAEAEAPPYGTLPAVDPALAIARHQTSGSSGMRPVRTFDTARDWSWVADMFATGLYATGIRPGDQVAVAFGYGMFIGFWAGHYGLQRIGATAIATGSFDSRKRIELLVEEDVRAILCTPTYALRLAQVAQEIGVDLKAETSVEIVLTSGEPRPAQTRGVIEQYWGAAAVEVAGMTEAGTLLMFECGAHAPGMHVIESDLIEEILDPDTKEPVDYGTRGVRVMTSLGREGIGILRYWTNDIVVRQPAETCQCGRTWDYYEGGILGRADDVRKIRGVLFTPEMIEDIVRTFPDILEFQIVLETIESLDTLVVSIEPREGIAAAASDELAASFGAKVKRDIGITPQVQVAAPATLPRFEMKAKRFTDLRPGYEGASK